MFMGQFSLTIDGDGDAVNILIDQNFQSLADLVLVSDQLAFPIPTFVSFRCKRGPNDCNSIRFLMML